MRIVAGVAGGRRLTVPRGRDTRPTSERVREALFAALVSDRGGLAGDAVLDLFAGSGALGLEALSRGAATAVLVERDPTAAATARANIDALGLPGASVVATAVARYLARAPVPAATAATAARAAAPIIAPTTAAGRRGAPADIVFADPPYALPEPEVGAMLAALAGGWLRAGASIVVERAVRSPAPSWPPGCEPGRVRTYGDTAIHPARWAGSDREEPPA